MNDLDRAPGTRLLKAMVAVAALALAASSVRAATWTVNTTVDESIGSCAVSCSLRDAVALAEPSDTIQIPAGHYKLVLGDIIFAKSLTINGAGARTTVLDGNGASRIFQVTGPIETTVLEINDLALVHGWVDFWFGGALAGGGLLRLNRCRVADSESAGGGGIAWGGDAILDRCTLSGNNATHGRGGGFAGSGGTVTMINTTLTRNVAAFGGGLSIFAGQVLLVNTTITENQAVDGSGIEVNDGGENQAINSIIASNSGFNDCLSAAGRRNWLIGDHSLFGSGRCSVDPPFDFGHGNRFGNARVAPLFDKSGPTDTRALVAGSQAIDAGNNSMCPPIDERGVPRPQNGTCDMGAYEKRQNEPPILELDVDRITANERDFAFNHLVYSALDLFPVTLSASAGSLTRLLDGSYQWSVLTGDGPDSRIVTITGDDGHGSRGTASFRLDVTNSAPGIVSLTNNGPVVAGAEALIAIEALDPAGALDPLAYQVDCDGNGIFEVGPQAAPSAACRFASAGLHTVNVLVTDGDGGADQASTEVMVNPDCSHATASPSLLWPPDHNLTPIEISGVLGGELTLVTVSIFQDEAVSSHGAGNTAPDGFGVGTGRPSVRAERAAGGDGRVYHISFTAQGGGGSVCSGTVTVGVPRNQGNSGSPVDQGSLFDSTLP